MIAARLAWLRRHPIHRILLFIFYINGRLVALARQTEDGRLVLDASSTPLAAMYNACSASTKIPTEMKLLNDLRNELQKRAPFLAHDLIGRTYARSLAF